MENKPPMSIRCCDEKFEPFANHSVFSHRRCDCGERREGLAE